MEHLIRPETHHCRVVVALMGRTNHRNTEAQRRADFTTTTRRHEGPNQSFFPRPFIVMPSW